MTDDAYITRRVTGVFGVAILSIAAVSSLAVWRGNDTKQARDNNLTRLCLKSSDPQGCGVTVKLHGDVLRRCDNNSDGEHQFADCLQKAGIHG